MCNISLFSSENILQVLAGDTNLFLVGDDLKEVCEPMSFEGLGKAKLHF